MGAPYRSASARAALQRLRGRRGRSSAGATAAVTQRVAGPALQEALGVGERVGDRLVVGGGELDERLAERRRAARPPWPPPPPGPRSSTCPRRWWCRSGSSPARPARVPAFTNSAVTFFVSAGKMYFCSQSISAGRRRSPRKRTIGAWRVGVDEAGDDDAAAGVEDLAAAVARRRPPPPGPRPRCGRPRRRRRRPR